MNYLIESINWASKTSNNENLLMLIKEKMACFFEEILTDIFKNNNIPSEELQQKYENKKNIINGLIALGIKMEYIMEFEKEFFAELNIRTNKINI